MNKQIETIFNKWINRKYSEDAKEGIQLALEEAFKQGMNKQINYKVEGIGKVYCELCNGEDEASICRWCHSYAVDEAIKKKSSFKKGYAQAVKDIINLFKKYGIYTGKVIEFEIKQLLEKK